MAEYDINYYNWCEKNNDRLLEGTLSEAVEEAWIVSKNIERIRIINIIKELAGHRMITDQLIERINTEDT